jgi:hypothetical protein
VGARSADCAGGAGIGGIAGIAGLAGFAGFVGACANAVPTINSATSVAIANFMRISSN